MFASTSQSEMWNFELLFISHKFKLLNTMCCGVTKKSWKILPLIMKSPSVRNWIGNTIIRRASTLEFLITLLSRGLDIQHNCSFPKGTRATVHSMALFPDIRRRAWICSALEGEKLARICLTLGIRVRITNNISINDIQLFWTERNSIRVLFANSNGILLIWVHPPYFYDSGNLCITYT